MAIAPGDGWHGGAFRLRWSGGAMVLLAAIESSGLAIRADTGAPRTAGARPSSRPTRASRS